VSDGAIRRRSGDRSSTGNPASMDGVAAPDPSLANWLLVLGAGASVPPPTELPTFADLSSAVLRGLGWTQVTRSVGRQEAGGERWWEHKAYGRFAQPAMSPEVLFGALTTYRVDYAKRIADRLTGRPPNAVHAVAAQVLHAKGLVWTTNFDRGVEDAYGDLDLSRLSRAADQYPDVLHPLEAAVPGSLAKLHGTVDAVTTLAFADEELTRPLQEGAVDALAEVAYGRTVVIYGYAAADADLTGLLVRVFRNAGEIVWFEPDESNRRLIRRAFPELGDVFDPTELPSDDGNPFAATEKAFLGFVERRGGSVEPDLAALFLRAPEQNFPEIRLPHPPGLVYARLIERWGPIGAQRRAIWTARIADLTHLRVRTLKGHLRWALRRSLYSGHLAPAAVRLLASRPSIMLRMSAKVRDYILTRNCALLLGDHEWDRLGEFAEWAIKFRHECNDPPNPSDLYYRSQANRYRMLPVAAHEDASQAEAGLSDDLERLAGALYEAGSAAIYEARFDEALWYAFDLQYRRGRYAIPRWQAWGAWIEVVALCHQNRFEEAGQLLKDGFARFVDEDRPDALADLRNAQLLHARVKFANNQELGISLEEPTDAARRGRYRDDLDLVLADIAIAQGHHAEAANRINRILAEPSCPIAEMWARIGRAELDRLGGLQEIAADAFATIADDAHRRGATWMELQAVAGLFKCSDGRYVSRWSIVRECLTAVLESATRRWAKANNPSEQPSLLSRALDADSIEPLIVGEPRVLWMMTV
jgi:hypothetical protein